MRVSNNKRRANTSMQEGMAAGNQSAGAAKVVFTLMIAAMLFLVGNSQVFAGQEEDLQTALSRCAESLKDKRLDIIRGKIPMLGQHELSLEARANNSRPTEKESVALKLYMQKDIECGKQLGMATSGKVDVLTDPDFGNHVGRAYIYYLMSGFITYSEYAEGVSAISNKAIRDVETTLSREKSAAETLVLWWTPASRQ